MIRWLMVVLVACERAEPTPPLPTPPPPPSPIDGSILDQRIEIRVIPNRISIGPRQLVDLTANPSLDEIERAVADALSAFHGSPEMQIVLSAFPELEITRVHAIVKGITAAGFTRIEFGVAAP